MDISNVEFTYWVEIRHAGEAGWHHIHHPDWETSHSYGDTMAYAMSVRQDHSGSEVRIVEQMPGGDDHHIKIA
jgi:hypothetical protein